VKHSNVAISNYCIIIRIMFLSICIMGTSKSVIAFWTSMLEFVRNEQSPDYVLHGPRHQHNLSEENQKMLYSTFNPI